MTTLDDLWRNETWRQIPNCPGRYKLSRREPGMTPVDLVGEIPALREYNVPACRDIVIVTELSGGGLISYRRANGTYLHTLNTPEGFVRKLGQLGIG